MHFIRIEKSQNLMKHPALILIFSCIIFFNLTCTKSKIFNTKNHIFVVIDGVRYSEFWGDESKENIPKLSEFLAPQGVLFTNIYNLGLTKTISSHAALVTGFYEELENSGKEFPGYPSLLQRWLKESGEPKEKAWYITSKGKLAVLVDTKDEEWRGTFLPSQNCGIQGLGLEAGLGSKGYRSDEETWKQVMYVLKEYQPQLVLINFKGPDTFGPKKIWEEYIQAIQQSDEYVYQLWQWIQDDPFYSATTALYITSDHGRHLDNHKDGFLSHGDACQGCQHISLLALGPDFHKGKIVRKSYQIIDIPVTVGSMLGLTFIGSEGRILKPLFSN